MHIINKDVPGYYKDVQAYRIYLVLDCNRHALYAGDRKHMGRIDTYRYFYYNGVLSI